MRKQVNYETWKETAESTDTFAVGLTTTRDIYKLENGITLMEHWVSPYNWFKPSFNYVVIDWTTKITEETTKELAKYGGTFAEYFYTDEGYGLPEFNSLNFEGDDTYIRKAFDYINEVICKYEPELTAKENV